MVKTKDEILSALKEIVGESTDDKTISFIEDVTDTLTDFEGRVSEDWKTKFDENDKMWREKYRARFFDGGAPEPTTTPASVIRDHEEDAKNESEKLSYDELFENKEMRN